MNQLELIQSFAKGKATDNAKFSERNAVIYTRVSTKEQADTNQSLETQKKYCLQYYLNHELNVLDFRAAPNGSEGFDHPPAGRGFSN